MPYLNFTLNKTNISTDLVEDFAGKHNTLIDALNTLFADYGTATLSSGIATVSSTAVKADSIILLTQQNVNGTNAECHVSNRNVGTDFTITSGSVSNSADVAWLIINP